MMMKITMVRFFTDTTPTICIPVSEYEKLKALQKPSQVDDEKEEEDWPIKPVLAKESMRQKKIKSRRRSNIIDGGSKKTSKKLSKIKTSFRNYFRLLSDISQETDEKNAFFGHNLLSVSRVQNVKKNTISFYN